nr:sulfate/thiosulfate transporter subunit [Candidatus Pantoea persica]
MAIASPLWSRGGIAQIDTPQAIYQRPATRFVADFVGAINCVETDAQGRPRQFCRPEDILLAEDERYARHGYIVGSTFLGAAQRLLIDIGLAAPIQVERHAREMWQAGQCVIWTLAPRAALEFNGY